ncbi:hypothetical protein ACOSP7_020172 [Xanthoceras sorbifolium]
MLLTILVYHDSDKMTDITNDTMHHHNGRWEARIGRFSENTSTLALLAFMMNHRYTIQSSQDQQPVRSGSRDQQVAIASSEIGSKGQRVRE